MFESDRYYNFYCLLPKLLKSVQVRIRVYASSYVQLCTVHVYAYYSSWQLHTSIILEYILEFGTRYTKTSCFVYRVYQYIHDIQNVIHDTYTIILCLQLSIVVQQNFAIILQNFLKFSLNFL